MGKVLCIIGLIIMFFLSVFCFCKAAGAATWTATAEYFYWENAGVESFGDRDPEKAIMLFSIPTEVKIAFLADIKLRESGIKKYPNFQFLYHEKLDEMIFGDYKIVKNVIVLIPKDKREGWEISLFVFEGYKYCLSKPIVCNNWAWWKEEVKKEVARPLVINLSVKKSEVVFPPKTELKEEAVIKPTDEQVKKPFYENETCLWSGAIRTGWFVGGKHNSFFVRQTTFSEGIGVTVNTWKGVNDNFHYSGNRITVGPVVKFSGITATAQLGQQKDFGFNDLGYESSQKTKILNFGLTADFYEVGQVLKVEIWSDVNADIGHSKESFWQNISSNDSVKDKTNFNIGSKICLWELKKIKGGAVIKTDYANEDCSFGKSVGSFIADNKDTVKVGLELRNVSGSKYCNSNGNIVGVNIDVNF